MEQIGTQPVWNIVTVSLWDNRGSANVEQLQQSHCGTIINVVPMWNNRNSANVEKSSSDAVGQL